MTGSDSADNLMDNLKHVSRILDRFSYISTKHGGATRAHPDNWKMKTKNFFRASCGLIATAHLSTGSDQLLGPGITQVLATPLPTWHKMQGKIQPTYFQGWPWTCIEVGSKVGIVDYNSLEYWFISSRNLSHNDYGILNKRSLKVFLQLFQYPLP